MFKLLALAVLVVIGVVVFLVGVNQALLLMDRPSDLAVVVGVLLLVSILIIIPASLSKLFGRGGSLHED